MRIILTFLLLFVGFLTFSQVLLPIIPKPNQIEIQEGYLDLNKLQGIIVMGDEFNEEGLWLETKLKNDFGIEFNEGSSKIIESYILLKQLPEGDSSAYKLSINSEQIIIESAGKAGVFSGIQTLLQLISTAKNLKILQLEINDAPRFSWRGMHLDCSRHFFTVDEVKKYLDYLALYKMNVFHWHLTDDQGWRIEIKKYPKLTEVGSWRSGTMIGAYSNHQYDSIRYGGFYTQDQIREVVAYAAKHHITIVPEIEMPGHSLAILAAYPNLACKDSAFEVSKTWGVFDDVLCAGNEEVFTFLENVLDEVITLFPSEYIHIGGDECPKTRWQTCDKCQKRISVEHLADEHQLQSYFIQRIEKYLNAKGRKIIGWDEILEGGLAPNAAVMSWRGIEGGVASAKSGHYAVMTPGKPCYFDHYQVADKTSEPHAIGGLNTVANVYNYNPLPDSLTANEASFILGAQGNVWTEYILSFSQVEYMALPRMAALAEALWTKPEDKFYPDFIARLKLNSKLLDKMNAHYAKHFLTEKI